MSLKTGGTAIPRAAVIKTGTKTTAAAGTIKTEGEDDVTAPAQKTAMTEDGAVTVKTGTVTPMIGDAGTVTDIETATAKTDGGTETVDETAIETGPGTETMAYAETVT